MAEGRKLRPWLVAQAESGRFPGLVWDDAGRSALRIPWQHAGKGGARGGAGAALCQAWAEFKGRLRPGARPDPAGWKTRLRCALNKSRELQEAPERSRLEGPRPYKVYRLLPPAPAARRRAPPPPTPPPPPEAAGGGGGADADPAPPAPAAPPAALKLEVVVESPQPLPPLLGEACLQLRVWLGGALAWRGWLPPGDYLLAPPPAPPRPGLLPRLLLRAPPPADARRDADDADADAAGRLLAGLRPGLLLASARRGLFLRRRPAPPGPAPAPPLHLRAPHAPPGALPPGALLQAFDAQRFRQEVGRHRAGLGPRPEHRVTLAVGQELGPHDGPHNRTLVLQLEQAFALQLLDSAPDAAAPPGPLPAEA